MLEDLGDLGDPLDEDEAAQLAERVVERVQHREEEDAGARDRGRDVAEHVDLGAPRPLRPVAEVQRHAARLERGPHRPAHVDVAAAGAARAARAPASRGAASAGRPRDGPRSGPGRGWSAGCGRARRAGAREGACRCARSSPARARGAGGARTGGCCPARGPARPRRCVVRPACRSERSADPLHVDADHARALALAPERGHREPGQVAHLTVVALGDRLADRLAELVEVDPVAEPSKRSSSIPRSSASVSAARKKWRSKSSSKMRRSSCDLAIVAASASRKSR